MPEPRFLRDVSGPDRGSAFRRGRRKGGSAGCGQKRAAAAICSGCSRRQPCCWSYWPCICFSNGGRTMSLRSARWTVCWISPESTCPTRSPTWTTAGTFTPTPCTPLRTLPPASAGRSLRRTIPMRAVSPGTAHTVSSSKPGRSSTTPSAPIPSTTAPRSSSTAQRWPASAPWRTMPPRTCPRWAP